MAWIPHPDDIVVLRASGDGDMGDVTDRASVARFKHPDLKKFALVYVKVRFTGGTGNATLSMKVDDEADISEFYDFLEEEWEAVGTDADKDRVDWLIPNDEYPRYVYQPGQELVFEWTNPDAQTMRWSIEVGLADATQH